MTEEFELTFYLRGGQTVTIVHVTDYGFGFDEETGAITSYELKLADGSSLRSVLFVPGDISGVTAEVV